MTTVWQAPVKGEGRPGYKHTKLGWIPEEWEVKALGKCVEAGRRITYGIVQPGLYDPNGRYLVRGKDYSFGWVAPEDFFRVTPKVEEPYRRSRLKGGDILLTIVGAGVGNVTVVPEWLEGANITQTTARIAIEREYHEPSYFYHYLSSGLGVRLVHHYEKGGAQPGLNIEDINLFAIACPPKEEQRRIAAVLGAWDRAIATVQQLLVAQQERKRGLMQELLTGRRRFKGFEPKDGTQLVKSRIGMVPSDWKEVPMRKLFTERDECGFHDLPLLSVTSTGVVLQSETERKDNSKEDKSAYKRICPGDIGYNTMRMWQGRSAVSRIEGIVSPAYTIITPTKLMDVEYAGHLFQYQPMVHVFYRYSQGMASDTWNLKYKHFGPIVIPVPTIGEQRAIASLLSAIDKYVIELEAQLNHITTQKRGLMQQLLTGAVRVKPTM